MHRIGYRFSLLVFCLLARSVLALEPFPLAGIVQQAQTNLAAVEIEPTRLGRSNYLEIISGIVNHFQKFQSEDCRIMDPFLHKEFQYATPCYAWAATALVVSGKQTNLLESAALALECATKQLAENRAAMNHGDFFTFPCMLAYENLRDRIPPEQRRRIENSLKTMDPGRCYHDVLGQKRTEVHNWNIVGLSGEFLRFQNGFTNLGFVERYLGIQLTNFTATGQYRDPNVPMAYDHFPRHFLAAILERGYEGEHRAALQELLNRAAWTSLLMQSPTGELPTGGRSAQHQWNEAQQCVTFEIWAKRNLKSGNEVAARACKRAAHLSLQSIQRWVRPSGELWIVKNYFDPAVRHGFQNYSSHSQYNLLAASMLSTAWLLADDSIPEGACPADIGGFAFELPEFHKIFANAGGLYLEIDTSADPEYNSTGILRIHKSGVEPLLGPTDNAPISEKPVALGISWRNGTNWESLAESGLGKIKKVRFVPEISSAKLVEFSVEYETENKSLIEHYRISPEEIRVRTETKSGEGELRVQFPILVFDGCNTPRVELSKSKAVISRVKSRAIFTVETPLKTPLHRTGELISNRNGFLEAIEGEVAGNKIVYTIRLEK